VPDNPYSNIKPIVIDVDEIDDILKKDAAAGRTGRVLFEVPLLYIYNNETTATYAEFELEGVDSDIKPLEAIDIFMQRVREFGKPDAKPFPKELLAALTDAELDLFLSADTKEEFFQAIKEMIYIHKPNEYYKDRYGFRYYIAAVGVKDAVLLYEYDEKFLILHTTPQQLEKQGAKLAITHEGSAKEIECVNLYKVRSKN
jgi:hypothetical protein